MQDRETQEPGKQCEITAANEATSNADLYIRQIKMLRMFLEKGAISQAQYDKSAGDLSRKWDSHFLRTHTRYKRIELDT